MCFRYHHGPVISRKLREGGYQNQCPSSSDRFHLHQQIPSHHHRQTAIFTPMVSHSQVPKSLKFNLKPIHQVAIILNFLFHITFYKSYTVWHFLKLVRSLVYIISSQDILFANQKGYSACIVVLPLPTFESCSFPN